MVDRSQQASDLIARLPLLRKAPQVCSLRRFVLKLAECVALFVVLIVLSLIIFFNVVSSQYRVPTFKILLEIWRC